MKGAENAWWKKLKTLFYFYLFICIIKLPSLALAEGNVGCFFVDTLCLENIEWCYDDYIFGKCLPRNDVQEEDLERQPLTEEQSKLMATILEELQGAGLHWEHPFVQCKIQGTIFSLRLDTQLPPNLCANLVPDIEIPGPQSPLAVVRFAPPNDDYADELYYPQIKKGFDDRLYENPPRKITNLQHLTPDNHKITSKFSNKDYLNAQKEEEILNRMKDIKNRIELRRMLAEYELGKLAPPIYTSDNIYPGNEVFSLNHEQNFNEYKNSNKRQDQNLYSEENDIPTTYFREVANTPISSYYPQGDFSNNIHISQPKEFFDDFNEKDQYLPLNTYPKNHMKIESPSQESNGLYTEGGLVLVPERNNYQINEAKQEEARALLANMLGFTRHERLDVKKPGPLLGPSPSIHYNETLSVNKTQKQKDSSTLSKNGQLENIPKTKKIVSNHFDDQHGPHSIDTDYAHVLLKTPIDAWEDGVRLVAALADSLAMRSYFTHPRIDMYEVSFRVEPNPERKTAADIARAINNSRFKNNISRRLGVIVLSAGVGNKIKSDSSVIASKIQLNDDKPNVTHIMAYMFAGAGVAALIIITIAIFLVRRHDKKRDKLGGLQTGISVAENCSKDYQELCRARMSGKGNQTETISSGRIISLGKENDHRPPSSRSSTSSWSEEPALSNMDISTGHMVLSYMEDHLRNKGRLEREWEALCRYEAEPCAKEAALQPQCSTLNRLGSPLPFDHSRVVLNHLANAEGIDYINASTITDHDPRAPAYIAAQGPLPTTISHFWQMIWEQGAVVIVSLCRLQENNEISCSRYWPEDGAELYHIYEVHLVSEHTWCDDYLVRSFYLKNLRTSETRTVTQFHFLSWPPNGVPSSAKPLLEFRRKVNKSYRGRSCPIVVHGSKGAGRTGAYILLDLVLGRMNKGAKEIDIAATLEHLRDQRSCLVATKQQFEFVLMAVAEEVHAILKALPANTQNEKRELDKDIVKEEDLNKEKRKQDEKDEDTTAIKSNDNELNKK